MFPDVPRCSRCSRFFRCSQMFPDVPRCSQMLPDVPRCSQILPDGPRCSQMLPDVPRCPQIPQNVPRCSQMLPDAPRCPQMFPDAPKCPQMLTDAPRCSQMFPDDLSWLRWSKIAPDRSPNYVCSRLEKSSFELSKWRPVLGTHSLGYSFTRGVSKEKER